MMSNESESSSKCATNELKNNDLNPIQSNSKVKKGSYPSKQQRFGAAPLASFEDLPSDDQQSPDSDDDYLTNLSPDRFAIDNVLDLDSSCFLRKSDAKDSNTSPTLTITPTCISSPVSSDRKESDTTSQNTLTLEGRAESSTPVIGVSNSGSISSLKAENHSDRGSVSSTGFPSKGSHNSLLAIPDGNDAKSPTHESKRKSSWTDIFFPGRSRSKSTSSSPRKSPTTDKKKGVFSKILNFGKKSPPKELTSPNGQSQQTSGIDTPRVSVTDTSENEPHEELIIHSPTYEPKASEQDILGILEAAHSQMESTPVEDINPNEPIPTPLPPLNLRKTLKRRESTIDDEVQSLPEILPSSRSRDKQLILSSTNNRNTETVVVQIESCARDERDNSSESEIGFDESKLKIKKNNKSVSESEDDFEAENLLTQDSIDLDDTSSSETIAANFVTFNLPQESIKSPTRKERLEITTIPIERPRSTTPINIVPLEAYIRSSSISPDPNVEKIKLSLPGEQFTACARAKSPRKSNPSIWFEFCEKGLLQSPVSRRKQRANSCFTSLESQNPFSVTNIDAFATGQALTPSPGNLTPVTPLEGFNDNKWPGFGDNFVNFDNLLSANGVNNDSDKFSCKCDCNLSLNANEANDANSQSQTSVSTPADESNNKNTFSSISTTEHEYMEDQPLVSPCHCLCHRRADFALSLWKSSSFNKQESVSSDISSASSRLIDSSSSNSKCSPTDEMLELNS